MDKELHQSVCDQSVFARIYKKYAKDVHDFLYYKFGAEFNPNDKTQDAFVKLWDNCKKVSVSKARSFLFTVAQNMVLNDIKHKKVVLKYQKQDFKSTTNESPEFLLEKEQFLEQYQSVLATLSEDQRVAFLLNKAEGKSHAEVAELLGVTKKVVEYRIYSAFKILKSQVEGFKLK